MADDTLSDAIETAAQGPVEAHTDRGGVRQHPLSEQIAADRYMQERRGSRRTPQQRLSAIVMRCVPPAGG
jgi:hypothetical protein